MAELRAADILYEDAAVVAVAKPAGVPVHATVAAHRDHLVAMLERYLAAGGGETRGLTLVHRLDVGTSGIVLFARTAAAAMSLAQAFRERTAQKRYLALAPRPEPVVAATFTVRNHLRERRGAGPPVRAVRSGGALAVTDVGIMAWGTRVVAVEARPHTGRRHQIRVHLADAGLPILGDAVYGGPDVGALAPRVLLHARELAVPHPTEDRILTLACPLPPDFSAAAVALDGSRAEILSWIQRDSGHPV